MRGKGSAPPRGHPLPGITPAYAGKSNALLNLPAGQRDHPRVCGEKEAAALSEVYETGSPPRMRGKVRVRIYKVPRPGITPAYAGKSSGVVFGWCRGKDHPRVCGEKRTTAQNSLMWAGSPPRMRGKDQDKNGNNRTSGITPAYAGKSQSLQNRPRRHRDHPRVCGEKRGDHLPRLEPKGSPPRMRGKEARNPPGTPGTRITPAYAGKRIILHRDDAPSRDHPRVCGEKCRQSSRESPLKGSPPRMRGKAPSLSDRRHWHRITPAYAGKRLKRSHSIGHFSCILCLFHSVLHRASASGGSRAGPCAPPCLPAQNAVPV